MPGEQNEQNQETPEIVQTLAEERAARLHTRTLLPDFMYCGDCGECHFCNDMSFSADVTSRAFGNAFFNCSQIDTETNEDDTYYSNYSYTCDNDDHDVTATIELTRDYLSQLGRLATEANITLESFSTVRSRINAGVNDIQLHPVSGTSYLVQYRTRNINGDWEFHFMINPELYNIAVSMCEQNQNYEFNYEHELYQQLSLLYFDALNGGNVTTETVAATEIDQTAIREGIDLAIQEVIVRGREQIRYNSSVGRVPTDPGDRDPINSVIRQQRDHRRWRDSDLSFICICEHCNYGFECDSDIDIVNCPKCNKETHNAQENTNQITAEN